MMMDSVVFNRGARWLLYRFKEETYLYTLGSKGIRFFASAERLSVRTVEKSKTSCVRQDGYGMTILRWGSETIIGDTLNIHIQECLI